VTRAAVAAALMLPAVALAVAGGLAVWALEESADVLIARLERCRGRR
jgi:hypothetical protein